MIGTDMEMIEDILSEAVHNGMVHHGNWTRLKRCLDKAAAGKPVTVGFIGGSITQDAGASKHQNCYAYRVFQWWEENFSQTEIQYVNAGIGATTSHFGVARVQSDLLYAKPDFVVIEFSVNDNDIAGIDETDFFRETYEGLVRRVYGADFAPAVLLVHNVRYNDGSSAEDFHVEIGKTYNLPCISMRKTVYPLVRDGRIKASDISGDNLHPNDLGHKVLAELITSFLERVMEEQKEERLGATERETTMSVCDTMAVLGVRAFTENSYENAVRLQNGIGGYAPSAWRANGFVADCSEQETLSDIFKGGWTASREGATIVFDVIGQNIAVQYRKSAKHPTPIAKAIVDDDEEQGVILDGNFDQDWGDKLQLDKIMHHGKSGHHKVEVRIIRASEADQVPFYLTSLVVADATSELGTEQTTGVCESI